MIKDQMDQISYCHSAFFGTQVAEDLAKLLVDSTGGKLSKVFITSSGGLSQLLQEPGIHFTHTVLRIPRV